MVYSNLGTVTYEVVRVGGSPLPALLLSLVEKHLHRNLERVILHSGDAATAACCALNASAFTVGRHIVMGDPFIDLISPQGSRLLLHEAVHAVQQDLADPAICDLILDPDPELELQAISISAAHDRIQPIVSFLGRCAIQRHVEAPCIHPPPQWVELPDLRPKELNQPANQAIEEAYKEGYGSHTVLVGSDFHREGRDIRLPSGLR